MFSLPVSVHLKAPENESLPRMEPGHFQISALVWDFVSLEMLVLGDSMNTPRLSCISEALLSFHFSRLVLFLHLCSLTQPNAQASETSAS